VKYKVSPNLKRVLVETRQELMRCLGASMPTKEFRATMIMAMVNLHVIEARIRKTSNLKERRRLIDEFNSGTKTVWKGIELLRRGAKATSSTSKPKYGAALP
jgi:hypothetical protein